MASQAFQSRISGPQPGRRPILQFRHAGGFGIREISAQIAGLPAELRGVRIGVLSDLHVRPQDSFVYDQLIESVGELKPELLLITGDMVNDKRDHRPAMPVLGRLLRGLRAHTRLYAILGNHDNIVMGAQLGEIGVQVLFGEREVVSTRNGAIELIGAPGIYREHLPSDFVSRFPPRRDGLARIVMAHFPDYWAKLRSLDPDIYLCGHTHGGQVCLPGGRPLLTHDSSPKEHCTGYHRFGRTHYVVNQGFGFAQYRIRLFCPAEMVLLTLQ